MLYHYRCPLIATDETPVERFLRDLPLQALIFETEQIITSLSPGEKINYDINHFCSSYDDIDGRIRFILALIRDHIIYPFHLPPIHQNNSQLAELMKPPVYDYFIPIARDLKNEVDTYLTDDLTETMGT